MDSGQTCFLLISTNIISSAWDFLIHTSGSFSVCVSFSPVPHRLVCLSGNGRFADWGGQRPLKLKVRGGVPIGEELRYKVCLALSVLFFPCFHYFFAISVFSWSIDLYGIGNTGKNE